MPIIAPTMRNAMMLHITDILSVHYKWIRYIYL